MALSHGGLAPGVECGPALHEQRRDAGDGHRKSIGALEPNLVQEHLIQVRLATSPGGIDKKHSGWVASLHKCVSFLRGVRGPCNGLSDGVGACGRGGEAMLLGGVVAAAKDTLEV